MKLITYVFIRKQKATNPEYGCAFAEDAMEWLAKCQKYDDGIYHILNVLPVTDEQFEKWNCRLKGM